MTKDYAPKPADAPRGFPSGIARSVTGRILTAPAINSINTFETPNTVVPATFTGAKLSPDGKTLTVTLPPKSVVILEIR